MNITVIGAGYVGLVSGVCMAEMGNNVLCIDNDLAKISGLEKGIVPIFESGLKQLIDKNLNSRRLLFGSSIKRGVAYGDIIFIAVGTPPNEDGSADLQHVKAVAGNIAEHLTDYRLIVVKSTVPVGTSDVIKNIISETLIQAKKTVDFSVISNPEFLREGAAVEDFMKPERIIVGVEDEHALEIISNLYAPFNCNHDRLIVMDVASAELTKYAANAMLATKISFINEMSNLAEIIGADIESVRLGIGSDSRIGYSFIYPGCGYGGSCFPKDLRALRRTGKLFGYDARILTAVKAVNHDQKYVSVNKLKNHFDDNLNGKTVAIWGLAFQPDTNDMRDAPSLVVISVLLDMGVTIRAFDPASTKEASRIYNNQKSLTLLSEDPYTALDKADCLIVLTEWQIFRTAELQKIKRHLSGNVIIDGRNIFSPEKARETGLIYYGMGR